MKEAFELLGKAAAYNDCPSFNGCGCNQCPLDIHMHERWVLPGEDECRAQRSTRLKIAAKYPDLPTGGLTLAEVARDQRRAKWRANWDRLTPEQQAAKQAVFQRGRAALAARRAKG